MSKLFLLAALIGIVEMAPSATQPSSNSGLFAADLFRQIAKAKTTENVILSPISVQSALAMTFLGAEGETATELEKGLRLPSSNKEEVGNNFAKILNEKKGDAQLSIANRIFVNPAYQLRSTFNERARKYFNSEVETVNFSESRAVDTINTWVEDATNNKITNLLQPGSVDGDTSALIVNAIYFKGKWQTPFSKESTRKNPFWISATKSVEAETMYAEELFKFAEFPELDATAVELPYNNSDLSMMIILPNERDGLPKLEQKLSSVAINQLATKMSTKDVLLLLPKFKIEFTTGLKEVLQEMGIRSMFEDSANLSGIFESGPGVKVSDVQHKAFIDVNEAGSEAAAASFLKIVPMSLNLNQKRFIADHPFVFAIKSQTNVYFIGHVSSL